MSVKIVSTRHRFPGNCSHGPALSLPLCLSSLFCVSFSTHDLLPPPQCLAHHDDLCLSTRFPPTQRRCAVESCIDCLTEAPEHCLTRNSEDAAPLDAYFHMSHLTCLVLCQNICRIFGTKMEFFKCVSISVHYTCTWSGVCWWKTSSIHLQLYAFNLLPKCKQTITAPRHVKYSFSSWDTVGPCNQSASQTANQHFQSNEKDIEPDIKSKWFVLEYYLLTSDWLLQIETIIQQVWSGTQSLHVITGLRDTDCLFLSVALFLLL